MTVSTPAQLRAKATYRAKQLSLRTAQAKRVEELEAALRRILCCTAALGNVYDCGDPFVIAAKALEGSAKP